jgi:membrane protease YdiL (CAAX protease family)
MHPMTAVPASPAPVASRERGPITRFIADHPALSFSVIAIGITWIADVAAILLLGTITAGLLLEFVVLIGAALLVTGVADGRPGLRRLLAGVLHWRVGVGWYVVAVVALPVLTLLIALATGTFRPPAGGWLPMVSGYVVQLLLFGVLFGNVWEEMGWTGVVQRRLMERHGLVAGGALTAIPFVLIHLPLAFGAGFAVPVSTVLIIWGTLIVTAPFMRWLLGVTYLGTGGSILLVGILHGSFNGSGQLSAIPGGGTFQSIGALVILLGIVWVYRAVRLRRADESERAQLLPEPQPRAAH